MFRAMPFETFKRQRVPVTSEPAITIQKRGAISMNGPAYNALQSPDHLELLYDRDEQLIGMRKVDSTVPHAYIVRPLGKSGTTHLVSGNAFMAYYGIETGTAKRWIAEMRDDTLVVDLKQPGIEVTGNRSRDAAEGG
jgi:hypothetical protein